MGNLIGRSEHDKFMAKHRGHVDKLFAAEDYKEDPDHSGGTVFKCNELKCEKLPGHAHARRCYLIWRREG